MKITKLRPCVPKNGQPTFCCALHKKKTDGTFCKRNAIDTILTLDFKSTAYKRFSSEHL